MKKSGKSFFNPATVFVTIPEETEENNTQLTEIEEKKEPIVQQQKISVQKQSHAVPEKSAFDDVIPDTIPKEGYYISSDGVQIEKKTKTLSFVLRPSTYEKLKFISKSKGMKMNALVNLILEAYIKNM